MDLQVIGHTGNTIETFKANPFSVLLLGMQHIFYQSSYLTSLRQNVDLLLILSVAMILPTI